MRKLGLNYPSASRPDRYRPARSHPCGCLLGKSLARSAADAAFGLPALSARSCPALPGDNPNLQPFTREDLNVHMRQADFPPGVREWLTALAHPVLGRRDINWGAQFLGWDRGEMQSRFGCWATRPMMRPRWPDRGEPGDLPFAGLDALRRNAGAPANGTNDRGIVHRWHN
jgi:hypothetical protein